MIYVYLELEYHCIKHNTRNIYCWISIYHKLLSYQNESSHSTTD